MNRRGFLHRVGTASAALGATALLGAAEACGKGNGSGGSSLSSTSTSKGPGGPSGPVVWSELAAALTGTLVLSDAPSYGADAANFNELYTPQPAHRLLRHAK